MSILSKYAHILDGSAEIADPLDELVDDDGAATDRAEKRRETTAVTLDVDAPAFRYAFDWAPNFAETVVIDWPEVSAPLVDASVRSIRSVRLMRAGGRAGGKRRRIGRGWRRL
jgi:hypothetical protein